MSQKNQKLDIAERKPPAKAAEKGFAGREALVSGLYEPESAPPSSQKIIAANIVKETVMALVRAVKSKNALESLIQSEAEMILAARAERKADGKVSAKLHDLSTVQGVVGAALDSMNIEAAVSRKSTGNGQSGVYSIFTVRTEAGEDRVMVKDSVLDESDPVAAARKYLEMQGVAKQKMGPRSDPAPRRRASDLVELTREDLEGRKLAFQGSEDGRPNHFTYLEQGMESTITARGDLRGRELLQFLQNRITRLHTEYKRMYSSEVAEAFSEMTQASAGIERMSDRELRRVAKTIFMLAHSEEGLVPEEYKKACALVRTSAQFYDYTRDVESGVFTSSDISEFRAAFEEIDHPGHYVARKLHRELTSGGELTEEGKALLNDTLRLHEGSVNMPEAGLKAVAEAYSMLNGGDSAGWDADTMRKNYFLMVYRIRKAVVGLGSIFKVVSDEAAAEESFDF